MAAVVAWYAGSLLQPGLIVTVSGHADQLEIEASGAEVLVPCLTPNVSGLRIEASDSFLRPGASWLKVHQGELLVLERSLPHRFKLDPLDPPPVADWWVDFRGNPQEAAKFAVDLTPPFTVQVRFTGRYVRATRLVLEGEDELIVMVRTGLLDEDLVLERAGGERLAVDRQIPNAVGSIAGILSTLAYTISIAFLLTALGTALQHRSPPRFWEALCVRLALIRPWILVGFCAACATALSWWTADQVLERLPHTPDGIAYLLSARWLFDGRVGHPAPDIAEHITLPFVYLVDGNWLPHHPLGWPMILAFGEALGSGWATNAILSPLWIVLLYATGRQLWGVGTGLLAAALGTLSPLARVLFGSHLSHPLCATLILASLYCLLRATGGREARVGWMIAAGSTLAFAGGIRPASAFAYSLIAVPFFLVEIGKRRMPLRDSGWFAAAGLGALLPTATMNLQATGKPHLFPYSLVGHSMFGVEHLPFGLRNVDSQIAALAADLSGWGWGTLPGVAVLALGFSAAAVPFILSRSSPSDRLLLSVFVAVAAVHLFTRGHGLHGFGPRYLFEGAAPLLLLSARGLSIIALEPFRPHSSDESRNPSTIGGLIVALGLLSSAIGIIPRLSTYGSYNHVDGRLERALVAAGIDHANVYFPPGEWHHWAEAAHLIGHGDGEDGVRFLTHPPRTLVSGVDLGENDPHLHWDGDRLYEPFGTDESSTPLLELTK